MIFTVLGEEKRGTRRKKGRGGRRDEEEGGTHHWPAGPRSSSYPPFLFHLILRFNALLCLSFPSARSFIFFSPALKTALSSQPQLGRVTLFSPFLAFSSTLPRRRRESVYSFALLTLYRALALQLFFCQCTYSLLPALQLLLLFRRRF